MWKVPTDLSMNSENKPFVNRTDAGERLANLLKQQTAHPEIIIALPRGGIPVALPISKKLGIPIQILIVKKIGHPLNPEYAIGALSSFGELWGNDDITQSINKQVVKKKAEQKIEELTSLFPEDFLLHPPIEKKHVVIVDDGAATGLTIQLAIQTLKTMGAKKVSVALPVCSTHAYQRVNKTADELYVLYIPQSFAGVGAYYEHFPQLTDYEAVQTLVCELKV